MRGRSVDMSTPVLSDEYYDDDEEDEDDEEFDEPASRNYVHVGSDTPGNGRQEYLAWHSGLPKTRPEKTGVFYTDGFDVIYRYSDGSDDCAHLSRVPEFVTCAITGKRVWEMEAKLIHNEKRGRNIRVSRRAVHALGGLVSAIAPHPSGDRDRNASVHTVRAWIIEDSEGMAYTKNAARMMLRRCPETGALLNKSRMTHYKGRLVSRNWVSKKFQELVIQRHRHREPFITPDSDFYCGIELEIEPPSQSQEALAVAECIHKSTREYSFMKRDGSLGEFGIEWVTHPITWEHVREHVRPMLPEISRLGGRSHEPGTCGIHVHLPKENLSPLTVSKIVMLWNSRDKVIAALCGRKPNRFCTQVPVTRHSFNGGQASQYHHASINTENPATIEFRSFRGTLNQHTFMARVGLCFAVAQYCKQCGTNPSWDEFALWFLSSPYERKMFPETLDMILEEGLKRKSRETANGREYYHLFGKKFHDAARRWVDKKTKKEGKLI